MASSDDQHFAQPRYRVESQRSAQVDSLTNVGPARRLYEDQQRVQVQSFEGQRSALLSASFAVPNVTKVAARTPHTPLPPDEAIRRLNYVCEEIQAARPLAAVDKFTGDSQVSSGYECNVCGKGIVKVTWYQCKACLVFDLCDDCMPLQHSHSRATKSVTADADKVVRTIEAHLTRPDPTETRSEQDQLSDTATYPFGPPCFNTEHYEYAYSPRAIQWIAYEDLQPANKAKPGPAEEARQFTCKEIVDRGRPIMTDRDLWIVLTAADDPLIPKLPTYEEWQQRAEKAVYKYHMAAAERTYRILSLDGGGIRGYMTIRIVQDIIAKHFRTKAPGKSETVKEAEAADAKAQAEFAATVDYFAGTSTGGLIAFCLSVDYPLAKMEKIYTNGPYYFTKPWLSWLTPFSNIYNMFTAKYNPQRIHDEIDTIVGWVHTTYKVAEKKRKDCDSLLAKHYTAEYMTLGDLRAYVFPELKQAAPKVGERERVRVLVVNSYDVTDNAVKIFNTHYPHHSDIRVIDVLRSTMAAPTFFPINLMEIEDSSGIKVQHAMIDGGVYANDPELTGLWATRMDTHTLNTYRLLAIGTGSYVAKVNKSMWGGYWGWLIGSSGLLVSTILQSSSEFTEAIIAQLARFSNIRRFKLNCTILQEMQLDDTSFPDVFKAEWRGHTAKDGTAIPPFSESNDVQAMHSYYRQFFVEEIARQRKDPRFLNTQTQESKAAEARLEQHGGGKTQAERHQEEKVVEPKAEVRDNGQVLTRQRDSASSTGTHDAGYISSTRQGREPLLAKSDL